MRYEICYLVGESNEPKLAEIKEGVEKIIAHEKGAFFGIETIDRRKLAYKVEKDIRGIYVTRRFELPEREDSEEENPLGEMTKKLNLYQGVLRFLIIKADKLPELKQREIPVKAEKSDRRFDRSRTNTAPSVRREIAPKAEVKAPAKEVKEEVKVEESAKKEESIDKKLDELLNI